MKQKIKTRASTPNFQTEAQYKEWFNAPISDPVHENKEPLCPGFSRLNPLRHLADKKVREQMLKDLLAKERGELRSKQKITKNIS